MASTSGQGLKRKRSLGSDDLPQPSQQPAKKKKRRAKPGRQPAETEGLELTLDLGLDEDELAHRAAQLKVMQYMIPGMFFPDPAVLLAPRDDFKMRDSSEIRRDIVYQAALRDPVQHMCPPVLGICIMGALSCVVSRLLLLPVTLILI